MTNYPYAVEDLYAGQIDAKPINMDSWSDAIIEHERAETWEAEDIILNDGTEVTVIVSGSSVVAFAVGGEVFESYEDYTLTLDVDDDDEPVGALLTEDQFTEAFEAQVWGEGPMMNYWYPLGFRGTAIEAAYALRDVCLCAVTVDDQEGIALTGGGMDLSWEICEAYVRLGWLPPVHFADLPAMADRWTEDHQMVYEAMSASLRSAIESNEHRLTRLADTAARMSGGKASW